MESRYIIDMFFSIVFGAIIGLSIGIADVMLDTPLMLFALFK